MLDREKVIDYLKWAIAKAELTGHTSIALEPLWDALALLREQEPRILKKSELTSWGDIMWLEERGCIPRAAELDTFRSLYSFSVLRYEEPFEELPRMYGKVWRCWTACPTDEQREAVAWDG